MYNRVTMMGRIANDLEIKTTQSGTSVLTFRLAVDRSYKDADGNRDTDFFNFVAWRSNADFIAKFFDKGRLILLDAEAQSRTYTDKNGTERLVTEFFCEQGILYRGEGKQCKYGAFYAVYGGCGKHSCSCIRKFKQF